MRISVLIATLDRAALLRKCLHSLLRNTRPADEVVVADQSEARETESLVRSFPSRPMPLRYLRVEERGKARALNAALQASTGDLLALTDDDVEPPARWIETIETLAVEHPAVAAFCGRVLPEPDTDPADYYNLVLGTEPRWITRRSNPLTPGFCGANIAVRRSALTAVGGYNVHFGPGGRFKNNDDGDLAYRLTRCGERLLFAPELYVHHAGWRGESDTAALKHAYTYGIGALAGYYLRRGHVRPSLYLAKKGAWKLRQLALGIASGRRPRTADARVQLAGMWQGFFKGLATARSGTLPPAAEPGARRG